MTALRRFPPVPALCDRCRVIYSSCSMLSTIQLSDMSILFLFATFKCPPSIAETPVASLLLFLEKRVPAPEYVTCRYSIVPLKHNLYSRDSPRHVPLVPHASL